VSRGKAVSLTEDGQEAVRVTAELRGPVTVAGGGSAGSGCWQQTGQQGFALPAEAEQRLCASPKKRHG